MQRPLVLFSLFMLQSCTVNLPEYLSSVRDRHKGPAPESEWNAMGLWRRVADTPPTYIPKAYPLTAPRDDTHGVWLVDARDAKRVFAPKSKVGGIEPGVLLGEARKVTNPPPVRGVYRHSEL